MKESNLARLETAVQGLANALVTAGEAAKAVAGAVRALAAEKPAEDTENKEVKYV